MPSRMGGEGQCVRLSIHLLYHLGIYRALLCELQFLDHKKGTHVQVRGCLGGETNALRTRLRLD